MAAAGIAPVAVDRSPFHAPRLHGTSSILNAVTATDTVLPFALSHYHYYRRYSDNSTATTAASFRRCPSLIILKKTTPRNVLRFVDTNASRFRRRPPLLPRDESHNRAGRANPAGSQFVLETRLTRYPSEARAFHIHTHAHTTV